MAELIKMKEAADLVGVTPTTVRHWMKQGFIQTAEKREVGPQRVPAWFVDPDEVLAADANRSEQSRSMQKVRAGKKWGGTKELKVNPKVHEPVEAKADAMLTVAEAGEILGCTPSWVRSLVTKGRLSAIEAVGGDPARRRLLLSRNELERFVTADSAEVNPDEAARLIRPVQRTVPQCLAAVEVAVRELRYAIGREEKTRSIELRSRFQELFSQL